MNKMKKKKQEKRISIWWREKQDDDDKFDTFYVISIFILSMKHYFKFWSQRAVCFAGNQNLPVQLQLSYPNV